MQTNPIQWLSQVLDTDVTADECRDGFVFVQLLGIIDPLAIDLTPYIISPTSPDYWALFASTAGSVPRVAGRVLWDVLEPLMQRASSIAQTGGADEWPVPLAALVEHFRRIIHFVDSTEPTTASPTAMCFNVLLLARKLVHPDSRAYLELADLTSDPRSFSSSAELPNAVVEALEFGHLYHLLASQLMPRPSTERAAVMSLYQDGEFLLDETEYPAIAGLAGEEYHHAALLAFLTAHVRSQSGPTFDRLEKYLQAHPRFQPDLHTPFDVEDGFLIWITLAQPDPIELSDLFVDVAQPGLLDCVAGKNHAAALAEVVLPAEGCSKSGKPTTLAALMHLFAATAPARPSTSTKVRIKKAQLQSVPQPAAKLNAASFRTLSRASFAGEQVAAEHARENPLPAFLSSEQAAVDLTSVSEPYDPSTPLAEADEPAAPHHDPLDHHHESLVDDDATVHVPLNAIGNNEFEMVADNHDDAGSDASEGVLGDILDFYGDTEAAVSDLDDDEFDDEVEPAGQDAVAVPAAHISAPKCPSPALAPSPAPREPTPALAPSPAPREPTPRMSSPPSSFILRAPSPARTSPRPSSPAAVPAPAVPASPHAADDPAPPRSPGSGGFTMVFSNDDYSPAKAQAFTSKVTAARSRTASARRPGSTTGANHARPSTSGVAAAPAPAKTCSSARSEASDVDSKPAAVKPMSKEGIKEKNIIKRNVKISSALKQSNKKLIVNALQVCLAGGVNASVRESVLEALQQSGSDNFAVLLRGSKNHSFKGLYAFAADNQSVSKIHGLGPQEIQTPEVHEFFKYDSGSRSFKGIPTRSFNTFVHGIALNSTKLTNAK
ncbi:hypothetical protein H9P43_003152 [Blastocladiella emersonii ATCC 22665]|nr:hypothetical protein H9P43_003152 [Blastocladiella emersonii ATCC 22665]